MNTTDSMKKSILVLFNYGENVISYVEMMTNIRKTYDFLAVIELACNAIV